MQGPTAVGSPLVNVPSLETFHPTRSEGSITVQPHAESHILGLVKSQVV